MCFFLYDFLQRLNDKGGDTPLIGFGMEKDGYHGSSMANNGNRYIMMILYFFFPQILFFMFVFVVGSGFN